MPNSFSVARATVVAAARTTKYMSAGAGHPLLLILGHAPDPSLLEALSGRFRVLAPEIPPEFTPAAANSRAAGFASWLDGFLEGLGLWAVQVIVHASYETAVRDFARSAGDRVKSVSRFDLSAIDLIGPVDSLGS